MTDADIQAITRAIGDPRRFEILKEIAGQGEMACSSLREQQPITPATLSHHLKELEGSGLIEAVREGKGLRLVFNKSRWRDYVTALKNLGN